MFSRFVPNSFTIYAAYLIEWCLLLEHTEHTCDLEDVGPRREQGDHRDVRISSGQQYDRKSTIHHEERNDDGRNKEDLTGPQKRFVPSSEHKGRCDKILWESYKALALSLRGWAPQQSMEGG